MIVSSGEQVCFYALLRMMKHITDWTITTHPAATHHHKQSNVRSLASSVTITRERDEDEERQRRSDQLWLRLRLKYTDSSAAGDCCVPHVHTDCLDTSRGQHPACLLQ